MAHQDKTRVDFVGEYLFYLLNQLVNKANADFNKELKLKKLLSLSEWRILAVLGSRPGLSLTELIAHVTIDQPTVSRIVERLAERKFVSSVPRADDGRYLSITLTRAGQAAVDEIWPIAMRHEHTATSHLSSDEKKLLVKLLRKVIAGLYTRGNAAEDPLPQWFEPGKSKIKKSA